jgi:hypothetical protein
MTKVRGKMPYRCKISYKEGTTSNLRPAKAVVIGDKGVRILRVQRPLQFFEEAAGVSGLAEVLDYLVLLFVQKFDGRDFERILHHVVEAMSKTWDA